MCRGINDGRNMYENFVMKSVLRSVYYVLFGDLMFIKQGDSCDSIIGRYLLCLYKYFS